MKSIFLIFFFIVLAFSAKSQPLMQKLVGRWKVTLDTVEQIGNQHMARDNMATGITPYSKYKFEEWQFFGDSAFNNMKYTDGMVQNKKYSFSLHDSTILLNKFPAYDIRTLTPNELIIIQYIGTSYRAATEHPRQLKLIYMKRE